jgi:quinol monooxygenase YgiN
MSFVVVALWTARAGEEVRVRQVLEQMCEPSRSERGCLLYRTQQSEDDPRVFLLYEVYRSRDDYEFHLASDHFHSYAAKIGIPLLENRERTSTNRSLIEATARTAWGHDAKDAGLTGTREIDRGGRELLDRLP